jgi:hypothetical protein
LEKLNLTGIGQEGEARADDDISKTLRKDGFPVTRRRIGASVQPGYVHRTGSEDQLLKAFRSRLVGKARQTNQGD